MSIYRLTQASNSQFTREHLETMYAAFEHVCDELGLSRRHDRMSEIVALAILQAARAGETDLSALRNTALRALGLTTRRIQ